jgi:hypothetical protein
MVGAVHTKKNRTFGGFLHRATGKLMQAIEGKNTDRTVLRSLLPTSRGRGKQVHHIL